MAGSLVPLAARLKSIKLGAGFRCAQHTPGFIDLLHLRGGSLPKTSIITVGAVAAEARWSKLRMMAHQRSIGKVIDDVMASIGHENPRLKGALPKDYGCPADRCFAVPAPFHTECAESFHPIL